MLIYHPAFDFYNCIFRLLQLLSNLKDDEIEIERLRIWDFYLTFPNEARHISFPSDLLALKKIFKDKPNSYEDLIDSRRIFERMKPFQITAIKTLISYGFIEPEALENNFVKRTDKEIPEELKKRINDVKDERQNIIKLVTGFVDLPLYGDRGLKYRTKLIDFKYDYK
ncbi:ABC-three component system middle component 5 [Pedobacter sp. UYP1]|uniref:ABC-three component system middle component 5 n=1 Tax=Pedobacter sp. UYP1 TaxID=1756396 RepID=UPI00339A37F4